MPAMLSSRIWLATVTGRCRHSAGSSGAQIRGEQMRPGTSTSGSASVIGIPLGIGSARILVERELRAWACSVKPAC